MNSSSSPAAFPSKNLPSGPTTRPSPAPSPSPKAVSKYSAQWYGLQAAFSEIKRLSSSVTSSGNPIEVDLKTMYKVKGLGTEQTIASKVKIFTEGEKITRVEDLRNDKLPDGGV
jgi:hypothetical protein